MIDEISIPVLIVILVAVVSLFVLAVSLQLPADYFKRKQQRDELKKRMLENPDKQFTIRDR